MEKAVVHYETLVGTNYDIGYKLGTKIAQIPQLAKTQKLQRDVFTHTGTIASLIHTYEYIWGTWLLFTKLRLDDRADFEVYDERFLGRDNKDSQIDIYL